MPAEEHTVKKKTTADLSGTAKTAEGLGDVEKCNKEVLKARARYYDGAFYAERSRNRAMGDCIRARGEITRRAREDGTQNPGESER